MLINLTLDILSPGIAMCFCSYEEKKNYGHSLYLNPPKHCIHTIALYYKAICQYSLHILFISFYMLKHPFESDQSAHIINGFKY